MCAIRENSGGGGITEEMPEDTPEQLAEKYKEDGNLHFRCKKYGLAIDSYTDGLRVECADIRLNCQLFTN